MRFGFKAIRRILGYGIMAIVAVMTIGYVIYAANGILREVEARDLRQEHDGIIVGTATALHERLTAVAVAQDAAISEQNTSTAAAETVQREATLSVEYTATAAAELAMQELATANAAATQIAQVPTETPTTAPSNTPQPTDTPQPPTLIPTNTPRAVTPTLIPTNTPRPSATLEPSSTATATVTLTPSLIPTPTMTYTPSQQPSPTYVIQGTYAVPVNTPVVEIPQRMPLMDTDPDTVNFLMLGSDTSGGGVGHTDVLILVSVNKRAGSVAMWHIPRDLFVYIPNHTMDRINMAYALGEQYDYPGGGFGLMKETILYNFGIEVDHYARVDFDDFQTIIEELGGLEVSVDCAIQDWKLIDSTMDPTVEDNWEYYTLPIGRQTLDPYTALWYVRSRKTTNDLDRGRRQMDVLRAMWAQARKQGLFAQVTQLWPDAVEVIETDLTLTDVLGLAPLAVSLDPNNIVRYSGEIGVHYIAFTTPDDKREVFLPNREALTPLIQNFLTPPTENRLARQSTTVEIIDASNYLLGFDAVAADRLAWEGYTAVASGAPASNGRLELTVIYDFTGQAKGSALDDLKRILRVTDAQVVIQPDPNRTVDFRVEIGGAYNSCVYGNAEDYIEAGPPVDGEE